MLKYLKYFNYICNHKALVFKECWKMKLYWRGITHDMSKFRPSEFIPYARYFYGNHTTEYDKQVAKIDFETAWMKHYNRNPHHWQYWCEEYMDTEDMLEMICDFRAMGKVKGNSAEEYYLNNYYQIKLNRNTRYYFEINLGLNDEYDLPIDECQQEYWETLGEIIDRYETYETDNRYENFNAKDVFDSLVESKNRKLNLDIYKLIKDSKNK